MSELNEALRDFEHGDPTIAAARALKGASPESLLALVTRLGDAGRRGHLEALGEAGLGKAVKKAARKLAYRLKSAGVEGADVARDAGVDLRVHVDLSEVAMVVAPGLGGQGWLVATGLPGIDSVEIDFKPGGVVERLRTFENLSTGRLKRYIREITSAPNNAHPVLADADLAVRTIDRVEARLRDQGALTPAFARLDGWRVRAITLGADPDRASARRVLADALSDIDINLTRTTSDVFDDPRAGVMTPPPTAIEAMFKEVGAAVHSEIEIERRLFDERMLGIAHRCLDAWLADDVQRGLVGQWLEDTADVLLAAGATDRSLQLLWVTDQLTGGQTLPHENPFLAEAFSRTVDLDGAWEHHQAFLRGEDHHHH